MADEKKIDYDFAAHETPLFNAWKDAGYFRRGQGWGEYADHPYTIVIPPPNITGMLHMGHALNDTIQDTCTRHARMQGRPTRWILGTDHAGIATQTKVDKKLADEGISRLQIGREAFIEECWKWREEYGNTIVNQIKGMGCSCDYDDEHFTLDPDYAHALRQVFADWYHDNLIYRGKRIVNWCPHCTTAIADDDAWHTVTLTHYYAQGRTLLYLDDTPAPTEQRERLSSLSQVVVGDQSRPALSRQLSEVFFWRSALSPDEVEAHCQGRLLRSSLELYVPCRSADRLVNEAQSMNTVSYERAEAAAVSHPALPTVTDAPAYDLQGRPLTSAPRRGFHIRGGRLVAE